MTGESTRQPEGAVVIFPHELVTRLFGYQHEGSTRKIMSEYGVAGCSGWPAEEVKKVLDAERPGWDEE